MSLPRRATLWRFRFCRREILFFIFKNKIEIPYFPPLGIVPLAKQSLRDRISFGVTIVNPRPSRLFEPAEIRI